MLGNRIETWHGVYSYDPLDAGDTPPPCAFEFVLERSWLGRFRGRASDIEDGAKVRPALITGHVLGSRIAFSKTYDEAWVGVEGTTVALIDWLAAIEAIPTGDTTHRVRYVGTITTGGDVMAGTWSLPGLVSTSLDGSVFNSSPMTGTWEARRAAAT